MKAVKDERSELCRDGCIGSPSDGTYCPHERDSSCRMKRIELELELQEKEYWSNKGK